MSVKEKITIIGGGPVGTLLSIILSKKGYQVEIFEKRADIRTNNLAAGRSINLALSTRGWTALQKAGLKEIVMKTVLPMYGRMVHDLEGNTNFQSYTHDRQAIYSVSRSGINKILLDEAESAGVKIRFQYHCTKVDLKTNTVGFRDKNNDYIKINPALVFGADGAFSLLRNELIKHDGFNYSQEYLDYGYKEIVIPPGTNGEWLLNNQSLHIWPRKSFMLIALPNLDGSFTCTLFLKRKGEQSFESLHDANEVNVFFQKYFKDIVPLVPDLEAQFFVHPVGSLVTIRCYPWSRDNYCLLGDSAHAIVPFYGQGMNCGFEDCSVLDELMEADNYNLPGILTRFQQIRKPSAEAIATMAYDNFTEMSDSVADEKYLQKKKIERKIINLYPSLWQSQYELVSFSNIPYEKAMETGKRNETILNECLYKQNLDEYLLSEAFKILIQEHN